MRIWRAVAISAAVLAVVAAAGVWVMIDFFTVTEDELSIASDGTRYIDYQPPLDRYLKHCESPSTAAPLKREQFVHQGYRRDFLYYVPPRLREHPAVLVVLHGSGSSAAQVHALLGDAFVRLADRDGFIVIYGNGLAGGWNDLRAKSPHLAKKLNLDEVAYFRELLNWAGQRFGADRSKMFYFGMSNGAQMILRLLVEAPELVTAAALVGASLPQIDGLQERCADLQPRPVMFVNGTADDVVPYEGGKVRILKLFDFGSVHSAAATAMCWVKSARLQAQPAELHIDTHDDGTSIDLRRWAEPGKPEVRAYRVNGGRHTIPMPPRGTACDVLLSTSGDMNTVEEAWSFFKGQLEASDGGGK